MVSIVIENQAYYGGFTFVYGILSIYKIISIYMGIHDRQTTP